MPSTEQTAYRSGHALGRECADLGYAEQSARRYVGCDRIGARPTIAEQRLISAFMSGALAGMWAEG